MLRLGLALNVVMLMTDDTMILGECGTNSSLFWTSAHQQKISHKHKKNIQDLLTYGR